MTRAYFARTADGEADRTWPPTCARWRRRRRISPRPRNGEIPTYGVEGTFGDMDDVRAHGRDERVGVKQYFEGLEFQYRLIKALATK